jgi:cytochrome oxidase Cu insertion factor (SCO1/SenC/PrrC family)
VSARAHSALAVLGALLLCLSPASPRAQQGAGRSAAELMDVLMWSREPVGGPFALVDHTGAPRTDAQFRGKLLLLYFGFTYCPDVCPTDLQAIGLAMGRLGKSAEGVQPLFVTLDPERDTPQRLAGYVTFFHPRLIGLTGDASAIQQAASAYKVYYAKVPASRGGYTIDHSGYVYLMDRAGKYLGFFPPGTPPDRMVDVIQPLVDQSIQPK